MGETQKEIFELFLLLLLSRNFSLNLNENETIEYCSEH